MKGKKSREGKTKGPVDVEYPYRGGSLDFGIRYAADDKKLIIRVMEAKDLQTFKDHECMDHFVKIRLYRIPKMFFRFKGTQKRQHMLINNLDSEYQTKIKRKAVNPVFNETFELRIVPEEMENFCIKFQLCDFDKYARQIVSGEVFLILQSIDFSAQQELLFSKPLEQATEVR